MNVKFIGIANILRFIRPPAGGRSRRESGLEKNGCKPVFLTGVWGGIAPNKPEGDGIIFDYAVTFPCLPNRFWAI
jgi:hypothetical protein